MRLTRILVVTAVAALAAHGQFGGILNRAKDKIDRAKQKAKPVSDRAERAVETFQPWSADEEQQIGEATAAKMVAMFGLVEQPKLVRYVNLVGQAVAQFAPRQIPYRFGILDADIVGAYALPGGYIFITKAAIEAMANEAQLAGALGHEIIHVSERHLEREIRSKRTSSWAVEEAKTKAAGPAALRAKADAFVGDMFNTSLSRDKEDAADDHGTRLAVQAGYDPSGLLQFLRAMSEANSKPENQRRFGQLLSTHPPFDARVERLEGVAESSGKKGKTLEARFHAALAP